MRQLAFALVLLAGCVGNEYPEPKTGHSAREDELVKLENEPAAVESYENQWMSARLCEQIATEEIEHRPSFERAEFAKLGMKHASQAIKLAKRAPEGHWYHLLNLGRFLEAQRIPEAVMVADLRDEAEAMCQLDGAFDYAGPHRFLGIFYSECPETPPYAYGDLAKADEHFAKALAIAPDFPENLIAAGEFQLKKMENPEGARPLLEKGKDAIEKHPSPSAEERESLRKKVNELLEKCK
jgi:tetratricopeptide (TPR) repeat protein